MTIPAYFLILPIFFPVLCSLCLAFNVFENRKLRNAFVFASVLINSIFVISAVIAKPADGFTLLKISESLSIALRMDGMSRIFCAITAILWPLTAIYAFDYMKHEHKERKFFAFFLLAYGATSGVSLAKNFETMYLFFELLTFSTLPLVMHKMDYSARFAGKRYLIYSIAGASLGFIALVFISVYGTSTDFVLGGVLSGTALSEEVIQVLRIAFTLAFFGFGVKAALFPMCAWLPAASVAPTPVTALLHAVAVVKAGAFACIRLTYYSFSTDILTGSFAQYIPMIAAAITVVFGSLEAMRSNHLKRRMAWSTVSNLSYILLAVTTMSNFGLTAASLHMIFHAFIKITLFFCIGAIMEKSHMEYYDQIGGIAKEMPVTMLCFTVSGIALMGVPPSPAFFSKWAIGTACSSVNTWGYIGIAALIISALLTAIYVLSVSAKAYEKTEFVSTHNVKESLMMNIPIVLLTVSIIIMGIFGGAIQNTVSAWLF